MKKRSIARVLVPSLMTFGIYSLFWLAQTRQEFNERGENIPTAWLLLVPGANLYFGWKWSAALARLTAENPRARVPTVFGFLLQTFAMMIAPPIFQDAINVAVDREQNLLPSARVV